jgi:5-methylcytosine-specific restriction protein A
LAAFHNTPEWQRLRLAILNRDYWTCQMCGAILRQGKKHPRSAVVDHIEPLTLSPDKATDETNLRSVCRRCHAICDSIEKRNTSAEAIRAAKMAYRAVGLDGYPTAN